MKQAPVKQRRRRSDKKYDEKFTKELMTGIRYKQHLSVAHLCMRWGICNSTYYNWIDRYPEFARAAQHGNSHYEAYIHECAHGIMDGSAKGNAAMLQFYLTNVAGWATKNTVEMKGDDSIGAITINILEAPPQVKTLEHLQDDIIDAEYTETTNVVKLNANSKE